VRIWKTIERITNFMSAEWILKAVPNSGAVVFVRSIFISVVLYLPAIGAFSLLAPDSTLSLDWSELRRLTHDHFVWVGALMGVIYTSLYARFSSQWQYLASLYNQIKELECQFPIESLNDTNQRRARAEWAHAFISDAIELHLATKDTFSTAIREMLNDYQIRRRVRGVTEEEHRDFVKFCESIKYDIPADELQFQSTDCGRN